MTSHGWSPFGSAQRIYAEPIGIVGSKATFSRIWTPREALFRRRMRRGELYLVRKPGSTDPRRRRVFVVVSRQILLESNHSTVICAPVYSARSGLSTQVDVGPEAGLKRESAIHCDELVSLGKERLKDFVGSLSPARVDELDRALAIAVGLS